jgi:hypothetical protein
VRKSTPVLRPSASWPRDRSIALEEDIVDKLTEIAKAKRVLSESLFNPWLKDKIRRATKIQKIAYYTSPDNDP